MLEITSDCKISATDRLPGGEEGWWGGVLRQSVRTEAATGTNGITESTGNPYMTRCKVVTAVWFGISLFFSREYIYIYIYI